MNGLDTKGGNGGGGKAEQLEDPRNVGDRVVVGRLLVLLERRRGWAPPASPRTSSTPAAEGDTGARAPSSSRPHPPSSRTPPSYSPSEDEEEGGSRRARPVSRAALRRPRGGGAGPGLSDALVGVDAGKETPVPGPCAVEKGRGVVEEGRDEVVVGGGDVEERE
ncbi:hypothetical protein Tsubulata_032140 [Turnera subulata]|uniref:Uncharacterized protein n=1 Tax=Turnera subulata TaxID=218843 RepID=A0A9Q0F306_9ROSI|nr:hypothetical protein Tsubulata_032140 [Turnera subulata]